jgi:indole-3-glycerol phosphate synthase/phosphoribosylanthranilate isomerase
MLHNNDILTEIIDVRKQEIQRSGLSFGMPVPAHRPRPPVPFLNARGVILEIKRASPSKGDIAPDLNAAATAAVYAAAGAAAVSVLTEQHFFKGSLNDLLLTVQTVTSYAAAHPDIPPVAVLRKDFLISPDEIDVSFHYGADAALLIARILDEDTLTEMALRCETLGMTALIELREDEDLIKLAHVLKTVSPDAIVCGINARNLADFTIDPLVPAEKKANVGAIDPRLRVIYESGIKTPAAASFAASMGFNGILLGESAARNPRSAQALVEAFTRMSETKAGRSWSELAARIKRKNHPGRPAVKICGITRIEDALSAAHLGADFIGFIFSSDSIRTVHAPFVRQVHQALQDDTVQQKKHPGLVGVITCPDSSEAAEAYDLVREGILDFIQYHDCSVPSADDTATADIPRYAAVRTGSPADLDAVMNLLKNGEPRILIDGKAGQGVPAELLAIVSKETKLWIAGGLTPDTISEIITTYHPELIDLSRGIESEPGKKDPEKMKALFTTLNRSSQ